MVGYLLLAVWTVLLSTVSISPWRFWLNIWEQGPFFLCLFWLGIWGIVGASVPLFAIVLACASGVIALGLQRRTQWAWKAGLLLLLVGFIHPLLAGGMLATTVWTQIHDGYASWADTDYLLPLYRQVVFLLGPLPMFLFLGQLIARKAIASEMSCLPEK